MTNRNLSFNFLFLKILKKIQSKLEEENNNLKKRSKKSEEDLKKLNNELDDLTTSNDNYLKEILNLHRSEKNQGENLNIKNKDLAVSRFELLLIFNFSKNLTIFIL